MGLLAAALRAQSGSWNAADDRWYTPDLGLYGADAGVAVTAETVWRCGTVLAAVRFLADSVAMCPPKVYQRTARGREELPNHYAQQLLRAPNAWQTGLRWRHTNTVWAVMWGNAYHRIVPTRTSWAGELRPLHPACTRVVGQLPSGALRYEYRPPDGSPPETLGSQDVLHFRGLSLDGMSGLPLLQLLRNAVGIALSAEKHAATFLRKGSRLTGILVPNAPMQEPQRKELRETWDAAFGGVNNTGTVGVLPHGVDFKPMASDNQKAQFLELRDFQVQEILRFLGVPGVVVGYADKTATYASADAFFEKGGIKHSVMPWVKNFEEELDATLLMRDDQVYVKFNLDALLRSNTKDRYEAHRVAIFSGWRSPNEARAIEDENPGPPELDEYWRPQNISPASEPPAEQAASGQDRPGAGTAQPERGPARQAPAEPQDGEDDQAAARRRREDALEAAQRLHGFVQAAARRVVRRELAAVVGSPGRLGAAARFAKDQARWSAWVLEFYQGHVELVRESLRLPEEAAAAYAAAQQHRLLSAGVAAMVEHWERDAVQRLTELALAEGEPCTNE